MSDIFANGLTPELVCMAVVAIALIVLIMQIESLKKAIGGSAGKASAAAAAPAAAPAAPQADNGELIAVIAAAIAATMEAEAAVGGKKANDFVVRSIRRVNNAPAWNRAGREEQVYSRM